MDVYIYKLKFKGPVHFGDTGIDLENIQETVSSDTVFSAVINAVNIYYGFKEAGELVEKFLNNPPFILSSLFIYNGNSYFLPRPMDDSFISEEIKKAKGKELKKLKWLERSDFLRWMKHENLQEQDIDEIKKKLEDYKSAFIREIRPRVVLDRVTQRSSIYHCGYIHFKKDAGLYGFVAFKDKNYIEKFENIISLLGQTGIGGEKTYGCGMFDAIFGPPDDIFLEILTTRTDRYTLLSLYHPSHSEQSSLEDDLLSYDIIRKKGWIATGRNALPLKRKSVGFISEGSVLRRAVKGCLINVTPDNPPPGILNHKVYRYGYAFTAPLIKEAQE